MSRAKSRQNVEICGDCGAPDATWASINKGILLCTQCCSIHRSLGRHISQVKSLQKSSWHPNQLAMVCMLNNNGANNIWEHTLLENNAKFMKKKPNPKDPISVKSEFIKNKHQNCAYTFRDNATYSEGLENELGKQLHASVRTANLETSFRLLVQGADPNYFHDERGTTPLHIAAKSDQKLQVELLLVYGADPTFPDAHGKTPIDYAKKNVNKDVLNRLIESQYDLTDAFLQYLTHRKPDHQNGIHFILPAGGFESNPNSLSKLQKMKNEHFEQLAMDVFDEIDRRETEARRLVSVFVYFNVLLVWLSCVDAIDLTVVPFLPVDSSMSKPRNQGRQKLARFTTPELKSLVFDILIDTQRRQMLADKGPSRTHLCVDSDDDPLYDAVAPDEDYATLPTIQEKQPEVETTVQELTKQLQQSDSTILDLKAELNNLKADLESLKSENSELKSRLSQVRVSENVANGEESPNGYIDFRQNKKNQRPSSMYETREGLKTPNWQLLKNQIKNDQSRNATQSLYGTTPDHQTVLQCTGLVTKSIQQLCKSMQDKEDCLVSGERVHLAVAQLATILPKETDGKIIKSMGDIVPFLLTECLALQNAHKQGDTAVVDRHVTKIRDLAYSLAKHTKDVVTRYTQ